MSEDRFTEGNLIVVYANQRTYNENAENLPSHIQELLRTCLNTMNLIRSSKPDKNKTAILIISTLESGKLIRNGLMNEGIDEESIMIDSSPRSISETFDLTERMIRSRTNPPQVYFICPFWLRNVYDSLVESKLKGYRIQFDGAPDRRPAQVVEQEKIFETPRISLSSFKKKAKNKAVDMFLNYIFREK